MLKNSPPTVYHSMSERRAKEPEQKLNEEEEAGMDDIPKKYNTIDEGAGSISIAQERTSVLVESLSSLIMRLDKELSRALRSINDEPSDVSSYDPVAGGLSGLALVQTNINDRLEANIAELQHLIGRIDI